MPVKLADDGGASTRDSAGVGSPGPGNGARARQKALGRVRVVADNAERMRERRLEGRRLESPWRFDKMSRVGCRSLAVSNVLDSNPYCLSRYVTRGYWPPLPATATTRTK